MIDFCINYKLRLCNNYLSYLIDLAMEYHQRTYDAHHAIVTSYNDKSFDLNNVPVMSPAEVNYWQIICNVDTTGESFLDYMINFVPTNHEIPLYICNNYKQTKVDNRCPGTRYTQCKLDCLYPTLINFQIHCTNISFGMCCKCYDTGQFCFLMKNKAIKTFLESEKIDEILWHNEYKHLSIQQKLNLFESPNPLPYEMFSAYVENFPICANCKSHFRVVDDYRGIKLCEPCKKKLTGHKHKGIFTIHPPDFRLIYER